jgi:predicted extracellular nuclease
VRDTVVPGAEDPDALIVGDLNSNVQEDPVVALHEAGYTELVRTSVGARAYSYAFDGQRGYLDHALASRVLRGQVAGAAVPGSSDRGRP